jgi:polyphosphate kinase
MTAKNKRRQIKQEARCAKTEKRRDEKEGISSASSPEKGNGKSPVERGICGPETLFNRELSWVAFNGRVLEEAFRETHPLLERLKFLAIFTSNLDEFFLIRFAGLLRQVAQGVEIPSPDGMTPLRQITALREAILPQLEEQRRCWKERLLPLLAREGIRVEEYPRIRPGARRKLDAYFEREVLPILTPQAVDGGRPFPHVSSGSLNLLVLLQDEQEGIVSPASRFPAHFPASFPWRKRNRRPCPERRGASRSGIPPPSCGSRMW